VSWIALLAIGLFLLLYLRSPIDLVPDRLGALGLLDDLIVLLATVWWVRRRLATAAGRRRDHSADRSTHGPAPKHQSATPQDPYSVLGVAPGASPAEIARAYREQMKLYHPDRVAGLGEELQGLAHRKAVEIQRAYQTLGKPS
jgi:hypothetical protein